MKKKVHILIAVVAVIVIIISTTLYFTGTTSNTNAYEEGYRQGFYDGYNNSTDIYDPIRLNSPFHQNWHYYSNPRRYRLDFNDWMILQSLNLTYLGLEYKTNIQKEQPNAYIGYMHNGTLFTKSINENNIGRPVPIENLTVIVILAEPRYIIFEDVTPYAGIVIEPDGDFSPSTAPIVRQGDEDNANLNLVLDGLTYDDEQVVLRFLLTDITGKAVLDADLIATFKKSFWSHPLDSNIPPVELTDPDRDGWYHLVLERKYIGSRETILVIIDAAKDNSTTRQTFELFTPTIYNYEQSLVNLVSQYKTSQNHLMFAIVIAAAFIVATAILIASKYVKP